MNNSLQSLYQWIARQADVPTDSASQWVWGILVLGFIFATVHLVTMLVTRWGDHHASSKSLLFSLLVHLSSGIGVVMLVPEPVREKVVREAKPIRVQDVIVSGVRQTRTDEAGNTPAWEQIPTTDPEFLSRMEREEFRPTPSSIPERRPEKPENLNVDIPEPKPDASESEQPELATSGPVPRKKEMAAIPDIESPELPPLPKPNPQGTDQQAPMERSRLPKSQVKSEEVQRPNRGGSDRLSMSFMEQQRLRTPTMEQGPVPQLPNKGEISDVIEKRAAPEQTIPDETILGEMVPDGEGPSQPNMSENRVINRSQRMNSAPANEEQEITRSRGPRPETKLEPSLEMSMPRRTNRQEEVPLMANLPAPNFDAVRRDQAAEIPATYRLRDLERRREIARRYGGTDASEAAVERALSWLASIQTEAGYWDGSAQGSGLIGIDESGVDRQNAGLEADTGLTALTILSFLGAGYTQEEGKYAAVVNNAIDWLIDQQREDGYLGGQATRYAGMYCHGMATYALAEAYGMLSERKGNDRLAEAVMKAVQFTVAMQNPEDGGWRYLPGWSGDMSMFGWQMMALKSAEIAGIEIPDDSRTLMVKFLQDRSLGDQRGLAAYHPEYGPKVTPAMTAEALFCKQMLGIRRSNPASQEAMQYLLEAENAPKLSDPNLYYWYYGTLAMYQFGGSEWKQWNANVRDLLVEKQRKQGELAGSWNPDGPWGGYGGRIYSTALATLSLEVYYRFLPLYRINEQN